MHVWSFCRLLFPLTIMTLQLGQRAEGSDDGSSNIFKRCRKVPNIREFRQLWHGFFAREGGVNGVAVHKRRRVSLVLSVFSILEDREFRDVIRETWMSHPGVCLASDGPKPGCSIYVQFAIGQSPAVNHTKLEREVFLLDIEENMDKGKTFKYFQTASRLYPWATHIGKMDMDVYPHLGNLLAGIVRGVAKTPPQCSHYIGRCCNGHHEAGDDPTPHDFRYAVAHTCCEFLQGGLYVLSRGLAEKISHDGMYWHQHPYGFEDRLTSKAIQDHLNRTDDCVVTWDPYYGWDHIIDF